MALGFSRALSLLCRSNSSRASLSNTSHILQQDVMLRQIQSRFLASKKSVSKTSPLRRYAKIIGLGFGVGTIVSAGYMYDVYKRMKTPIGNTSAGGEYVLQQEPPKHKAAREIRIPTDNSGMKITLYQYQTCPFCCKVRAFLDYFGFSYDVIEVNSVTRTQTKWTDYRKVPFLVVQTSDSTNTYQMKDSTMIISALQSYLANKTEPIGAILKCYPTVSYSDAEGEVRLEIMNKYFLMYGEHPPGRNKEEIVEERKWRKWVDDVLVHTLSPNVYRTPNESFQAFTWFSETGNWKEHFATWERLLVVYVGAAAMYLIGKNLKRRHQLKDDVRLSLYEETNVWLKALKKKGTKFMGGDEPNLSDLAVYGIFTAVEGCDAFTDLKNNTRLTPWFERMKEVVAQHGGAKYIHERTAGAPLPEQ